MEEAEVPLEGLQEHIHHTAEHGGESWISWVALSTAVLAVLAAISGLLSGSHANEAMMSQIEAADHWAYYQAKGIKASVLDAKMSLSGVANEQDHAKAERYQEEQNEISTEAKKKESEAKQRNHQDNQMWKSGKTERHHPLHIMFSTIQSEAILSSNRTYFAFSVLDYLSN